MDKKLIKVCVTCNGTDIIKTFANMKRMREWLQRTHYELVYFEIHKRAN